MKHLVNNRFVQFASVIALVCLLAIAAIFLMGASPSSSGVVSHRYSTLYAGTTGYTTAQNSTATDAGLFGAAEVHGIMAIQPSTGTVTITATWSNQTVPCSQVTQWTEAASVYEPMGDSFNTPILGNTFDAASAASLNVIVDGPVLARCLRFTVTPDAVTTRFTPTLYLRLVNHQ